MSLNNDTPSQSLLSHYLKPYRLLVMVLWFLLLSTITAQLINPQIIRRFLDATETGSSLAVLLGAAGLFCAIAILEQILGLLSTYVSTNLAWQATNRLREDVALHCLKLDMSFHKTHSPGEMIERIDGDINALGNFFSRLVINLLNNALLLLGVLILLWWEDWRVGSAITVIALLGLFAVNTLRTKAVPHWEQVHQATAELYGALEEWLDGREDIRANGATTYIMRRLFVVLQTLYAKSRVPMFFQMGGLAIPTLVFGIAYMVIFVLGDDLHHQEVMSIGTVYLLIYYLGLLGGPLWQIVNEVRDLQTAGASLSRVQSLLQTSSRIPDIEPIPDQAVETLPSGPLSVDFTEVAFRYEAESEMILQNITFQLAPGEVLGLLGRTGSGKTTLTRLLVRLIDPLAGKVRLGNQAAMINLSDLPLADLRKRVSMVTQKVQLFRGTLRDNLTFFDYTVPEVHLQRVVQELGLADWLAQLPNGLETMLGPGGQGFSAGEAQLIAFMRVFLQDPSLIILDEASSRLDPFTEQLLAQATERLLRNRTAIIIAHRLQTIRKTDKIMILKAGRILEFGERAALADDVEARFHVLLQHDSTN